MCMQWRCWIYAVVAGTRSIKVRLPDVATVFSAEPYAIAHALKHICAKHTKSSVIRTDPLSSLRAVASTATKNVLVGQIHNFITTIQKKSLNIRLVWVPSHVRIKGNELADNSLRLSCYHTALENRKFHIRM